MIGSVPLLLAGALGVVAPATASDEGVTLFRDPGFEGPNQTFTTDVPDLGLADESVSSLRVAAGCRVTLYREAEFLGTALTVMSDVPDLARTPIGDDSLSSLKIDCAAPRTSEGSERSDRSVRAPRPERPARGEGVRVYEHRDFEATEDEDLGNNPIGEYS